MTWARIRPSPGALVRGGWVDVDTTSELARCSDRGRGPENALTFDGMAWTYTDGFTFARMPVSAQRALAILRGARVELRRG